MKLSQDVLLGLFFTTIGVGSAVMAASYPFGTSSRMGPGYFPVIVSSLLVLTGILVLFRSRLTLGAIPEIGWKPIVVVSLAILIFGLVVEPLGLPIAVFLLTVVSATTSEKFRLDWRAFAGAAAFAAFCSVLFVELLGLPVPIVGNWLQGLGL
ncbi:Tripartite tricarboxylate transporter TctB family (plasmid) [Neorhizobium galegae bv. officinalis bv. officinalis str. HAMBI 1141]|jgi:putative tricarboxylic transport membrane protein|uniref:Tripartite tricarboxylate transporter TctB family n=1 Tax=Neorhizobium galegae bv. officinalis bv. officinalis str. HAMBI 1141 TaxID=1028801 RepID=A0A068TIG6_NEOGA|nr:MULTISPECIES: tripartite tricarboxylate transporter TctB family protein [Neorhizobium]MCJ9669081.1 tripartite tricarboxylate transporter TctB family protein [Neorhizobium sp. SHOUNA12B]MCJ9743118.1 tripartite tricarboxylate transporter TctB family protein [Neorhizobium sp. SHOUNA12A]MCJ9749289.1 tripartite tricarboxylate transporter TctB family protein [Neorhizobium sp. BETTINA12A]CDN58247.1 Tripartite tricarboxylate transporter TctB family [Neorhizobium galegae bv. officinalis bv. officinal